MVKYPFFPGPVNLTEEVSVLKLDIMVDILDTQTAMVTWTLGDNEDTSQVISLEFIFSPLHARYVHISDNIAQISDNIVLSFPTTTKVLRLLFPFLSKRHSLDIHGNVDLYPLFLSELYKV